MSTCQLDTHPLSVRNCHGDLRVHDLGKVSCTIFYAAVAPMRPHPSIGKFGCESLLKDGEKNALAKCVYFSLQDQLTVCASLTPCNCWTVVKKADEKYLLLNYVFILILFYLIWKRVSCLLNKSLTIFYILHLRESATGGRYLSLGHGNAWGKTPASDAYRRHYNFLAASELDAVCIVWFCSLQHVGIIS